MCESHTLFLYKVKNIFEHHKKQHKNRFLIPYFYRVFRFHFALRHPL